MSDARYDFAAVDAIDAESIGTPGKRTFRLRIRQREDAAALWVEKQQLAALGEALPRLLEQLDTPDQHAAEPSNRIGHFPEDPTVEFKVGRLALGYATQEDRLVLVAHELEDEEEDAAEVPTFTCRFTRQQARALSTACAEAIAGGRPICLLCQRPIDPEGHFCARANGHQKLQRPGSSA